MSSGFVNAGVGMYGPYVKHGKTYANIGNDEEVTIYGLAERVRDAAGSRSEIVLVPYSEAYPEGFEDMHRRKPSVEKLEKFTGFKPAIPLREIIERTARAGA